MPRLFLLILQLALLTPTLFAQTALPQQFDDYEQVLNTDSLERIVRTYTGNPERYMHGLISLELSRIGYSEKRGQDIENIKTLADQTKSDLGILMYKYLKNSLLLKVQLSAAAIAYLELKESFEARKDTLGVMACYNYLISCNINLVFESRGDRSLTTTYYAKITELGKESTKIRSKLMMYLSHLDDTKTSLEHGVAAFNNAINLMNQNPQYEYHRRYFYVYLGCFYIRYKLYKESLAAFLVANNQYTQYCTNRSRFINIDNVGSGYRLTGNFDAAKKYYKMAIAISKNNTTIEEESIRETYKCLAEIELKEKNYPEAWHYRNMADSLNQVMQEKIKSRDLVDIQIKYATDKKELDNQKLQIEKKAAAQRNLFLSIALVLSLLMAAVISYFFQKTRNQNAELKRLNELTERQNQVLVFSKTRMQYFNQSLSHDVLGYINNIINFLGIAAVQNTQEAVDRTLQRITRNANHLKNMSHNLIRYSRLEQAVELKKIDLNAVLKETLEDLPTENIGFDSQKLPFVFANYEFVKQVFSNLISNAIKYKQPNEPLKIQISTQAAADNGFIEVIVSDNGIGIDANKLTSIFKGFEKEDSHTEGSGLGLFICQQIVNSMGGTIWATSEKGKSANFHFTLPQG
jgi:signal transduction histidine kinase